MKRSDKAVCSKCGNVFDFDMTDGRCDKCSYYNSAPLNQRQYKRSLNNVKEQAIIDSEKIRIKI